MTIWLSKEPSQSYKLNSIHRIILQNKNGILNGIKRLSLLYSEFRNIILFHHDKMIKMHIYNLIMKTENI